MISTMGRYNPTVKGDLALLNYQELTFTNDQIEQPDSHQILSVTRMKCASMHLY